MQIYKNNYWLQTLVMVKINLFMPKFYIETYGCQMNVVDSEVVVAVLNKNGYILTDIMSQADVILVNTCSIRENAEQRIFGRIAEFKQVKKANPRAIIGVLGCMAERLKTRLLEDDKAVDMVVGPDAYRDLPQLLEEAGTGQQAINIHLSREETYADISPVRYDTNGVSAFVSIMRGCDNMCAFCVVPFTRGRERSRNPETIIKEVDELIALGYKEVALLGQNVDKYNWNNGELSFAHLLKKVAQLDSSLRVRFATSYPQDMTNEVLEAIASYDNICRSIHLPVQSGSSSVLERMHRGYTHEWYMQRIEAIRRIVKDCAISTDFIAGFCGETEEEHKQTIALMNEVKFDFAYMFKYSERPNTYAQRKFADDVADDVKTRRLNEIIDLQQQHSLASNRADLNKTFQVLVEGESRKSADNLFGRNSQNKVVVFPRKNYKVSDYVNVLVNDCSSATLKGISVE